METLKHLKNREFQFRIYLSLIFSGKEKCQFFESRPEPEMDFESEYKSSRNREKLKLHFLFEGT